MSARIPSKLNKWLDVFVSVAAAVVIYGALQKLLHTSIADIMLKIGLTVEALIFLAYGVCYVVFPYIDEHPEVEHVKPQGNKALASMEKMLSDAEITPASLGKLGAGFQKLENTVNQMSDISDVVKSTGDFSNKTKEATVALGSIKDAANSASISLAGFHGASESTKEFHVQMQSLTKNLSSLNTIYELELQEGNNNLKTMNEFYGKLAQTSSAMAGSAEDAMRAKEQINVLSTNLTKLNQLYGNMLSAMQGR
jgi:gliding motility-associated protein GldL